MKKFTCLIIVIFLLSLYGWGEKVAVFPQIFKGESIAVDDTQIYISQEIKIFIYSLKDYSLVKKFGTRGAGPREFRGFVSVIPQNDHLMIVSSGKISFFSKDGIFIREIKAPTEKNGIFLPLEEEYVGHGYIFDKKKSLYLTIELYSDQLKKSREIYRYASQYAKGGKKGAKSVKFNLMDRRRRSFQIGENKILIGQPDGSIQIFDKAAGLINIIKSEYERVEFTAQHRKILVDNFMLNNPGKSGSFSQWKNMLTFPEYFPPIQLFRTSEQKVYVLTHKRINQQGEFFIYDLQGKMLKRIMLPVFDFSPKDPYPLTIYKGKLYQIAENPATEEWELYITDIFKKTYIFL